MRSMVGGGMDPAEIEEVITRCEVALEQGGRVDLAAQGFWRAVGAVKRRPVLVERFADRIGEIDRRAFEAWAPVKVPIGLGTALFGAGTVAGLGLIAAAYYL
ncbi:MAG: hypothetical protein ACRDVM_09625, partial [Acidimicrobiia bacterium]